MHKAEYAKYLTSVEWQERRKAALLRAFFRCQLCNANGTTLDVHHRTYDRVGREHPSDLTVLCRPCHERFHGVASATATKPPKPRKPAKVAKPRAPRRAPKKSPPLKMSGANAAGTLKSAKYLAPVIAAMPARRRFTVREVQPKTGCQVKSVRAALAKYEHGGYIKAGDRRDEWIKVRSPRHI